MDVERLMDGLMVYREVVDAAMFPSISFHVLIYSV